MAAKRKQTKTSETKQRKVPPIEGDARLFTAGKPSTARLALVQPNAWNPNVMPPHKFDALKQSLRSDGWMLSQPLLVWASDERGRVKNIIIDGEHRWRAANEVGYVEGPMVFLEKITKAEAQTLTVKLDSNRGAFEGQSLATVLREILPTLQTEDPAAALGFTAGEFAKLLALPAIDMTAVDGDARAPTSAGIGEVTSQNAVTKMVPLYMDEKDHAAFIAQVQQIGAAVKLENVTDVVRHAVGECCRRLTPAEVIRVKK